MLRRVFRALVLLICLGALGAGAWMVLGGTPPVRPEALRAAPPAPARPPPSVTMPSGPRAALATPFGDALFRWRCTTGLREALGDHPGWPLRRIAGFCLCAADRLREDGPRDIVLGEGGTAAALAAAEERLCRRP